MKIQNVGAGFKIDTQGPLGPAPSGPVAADGNGPVASDQLFLSSAAISTLADSAARVAAVKDTVDSGDYDPPRFRSRRKSSPERWSALRKL